jgi:hypothetical protein
MDEMIALIPNIHCTLPLHVNSTGNFCFELFIFGAVCRFARFCFSFALLQVFQAVEIERRANRSEVVWICLGIH